MIEYCTLYVLWVEYQTQKHHSHSFIGRTIFDHFIYAIFLKRYLCGKCDFLSALQSTDYDGQKPNRVLWFLLLVFDSSFKWIVGFKFGTTFSSSKSVPLLEYQRIHTHTHTNAGKKWPQKRIKRKKNLQMANDECICRPQKQKKQCSNIQKGHFLSALLR